MIHIIRGNPIGFTSLFGFFEILFKFSSKNILLGPTSLLGIRRIQNIRRKLWNNDDNDNNNNKYMNMLHESSHLIEFCSWQCYWYQTLSYQISFKKNDIHDFYHLPLTNLPCDPSYGRFNMTCQCWLYRSSL